MNTETQTGVHQVSFLRDLLNRRVVQITGFYLGGGWGVVQFLDWIVDRYLLSPLLVDLALTIVASLLPSIVIMSYFHGSPGRNKWRKPEKIVIPVNLVLTVVLIMSLFGGKNLGSIAHRVSVTDERGRTIEKVVPRQGATRELVAFFLSNRTGQKQLDWMQYGLVDMLMLDLAQDPFLEVISPSTPDPLKGFYIYQQIKDAGFPDATDLPVMLQKKVAGDLKVPRFLTGEISMTGGKPAVTLELYRTRDNSRTARRTFKGGDIFSLVDEMSLFIKKSLDLPSYKNTAIVDLPVRDMFTSSLEAARLTTLAGVRTFVRNDYTGAQKLLEQAVKQDPTCTLAYAQLSEIYALNNQTQKWKDTTRHLMKYLYRLPQKMQMQLRAGYYLSVKGEPEKALEVLKMIVKLYPRDVHSYSVLATRLDLTGNYGEAIQYYKKILEINPQQYKLHEKIGQAYERLDDLENARVHYSEYVKRFPTDAAGLLKVGGIEEKLGRLDAARKLYEKALLLEPERVGTLLLVAGLETKSGRFEQAWQRLEEALDAAENDREKAEVLGEMEGYFRLRGQRRKSLETMERYYRVNDRCLPPLQSLIVRIVTVRVLLDNGRQKEAKALLDRASREMSAPFNKMTSVGYIAYFMHMDDLDAVQDHVVRIEDFVRQTGNRQFEPFLERTRADIALQRKDYSGARQLLLRIYARDRSNVSVMSKLAECLYATGEYDEGLKYVRKGLGIFPAHPRLNLWAARLYVKEGRKDKALEHVRRAVKAWEVADPGYPAAGEARELEQQLQEGRSHV